MRQKFLSEHGYYGDIGWFYFCKVVFKYAKSIYVYMENTFKLETLFCIGEYYAKSILPYLENTPIDIKWRMSANIQADTPQNFRSSVTFLD